MSDACVKLGGVAESIVEYAGEMKADLIMMPTRGLGPMRRFLIGSL
jgi:nucleotide-binding universal stress UspA family protein